MSPHLPLGLIFVSLSWYNKNRIIPYELVIRKILNMKMTISAIKADVGSIGGHLKPSQALIKRVDEHVASAIGGLIIDYRISHCGDDVAILMSHTKGVDNKEIHKLAWDAFKAGTEVAKEQSLYGAGQDLLKDAFSGNIKGMGPAAAELEFEERPNESFLLFTADKTDPGAYSLPFYLAFADPMVSSGLVLSSSIAKGFIFEVVDVEYTECSKCKNFHGKGEACEGSKKNDRGDKVIKLKVPEDLYALASLLRDQERFVISGIFSRVSEQQGVSISTTRLHNIAGKYTGKDDPIALARVQMDFPATGEIIAGFNRGHLVAGFMRGSHHGPLMPVKQNTAVSYFDGPPQVSGCAYSVKNGHFTEGVDVFDHPYWDAIRDKVAQKATDLREQGFFGPAMLPYGELEYGGIVDKLKELESRFEVKKSHLDE